MSILDDLVQLYCKHDAAAIEQGDGTLLLQHFNVSNPQALLALEGYASAFQSVSACAALIASLRTRHPEEADQVRESVRLLRRMIDDAEPQTKLEITRKLVEGSLRRRWKPEQQALYDDKAQVLEWRDFFVSYTDREARQTNKQFRLLINSCLGTFPRGEDLNRNHLAKVISRHLRRYEGLSGFFADESLEIGERIAEAVDGYCTKAFALVQLIEPLSFDREPPKNWCLHEYRCFSDNPIVKSLLGDHDRHFFVLTDALSALRPTHLSSSQNAWVDHIDSLKHLSLAGERNLTLRAKLKEIARQIGKVRHEVIEAWLAR